MNTNGQKLLLKEEVFQIVGCAIEVLNTLGHGLVEKPYENALVVDFCCGKFLFSSNLRSTSFTRDRRLVSSCLT
jgi:GxxExxY protein